MRRVGSILSAAALLGALLVAQSPPAAASPGWNFEPLDWYLSSGQYLSQAYYPTYEQHHVFNMPGTWNATGIRHGWYQPGYTTWAFETLDESVSLGRHTSTVYYPIYEQHHVFNEGTESGLPVLRHGWYQPGFSSWMFETLDAGFSTGTDTATVIYGNQHHVFNHGLESGQDVLRHGWFDPGANQWQFETLDAGRSVGVDVATMVWETQLHVWTAVDIDRFYCPGHFRATLHHLWFDGMWHAEDPLNTRGSLTGSCWTGRDGKSIVAMVGPDGRQNVVWLSLGCFGSDQSRVGLMYYDTAWRYADVPEFSASCWIWNSRHVSATVFRGHTEIITQAGSYPTSGLYHVYWDGTRWYSEYVNSGYCCGSGGEFITAGTYPPANQLHAFFLYGFGVGHVWYE